MDRQGLKVIVAAGDAVVSSNIESILVGHGFNVVVVKDGFLALQLMEIDPPRLVILDVALPGIYGFEILDFIRTNNGFKDIKAVLLASIYDKTRYKRSPVSLYGADGYIEPHHISDGLIPLIGRILGIDIKRVKETPPPRQRVEMRDNAHKEAQRLARLIVSDIALYNQELVEQGVREGRFYELLKEDIKEGELYYSKRVPLDVRKTTSYLKDAFEEFIERTKKRMQVEG